MAQGKSQDGSQGAGDDMHRSNGHSDTMAGANRGQAPPEPPTSFPLYVRIRAVVADWGIPEERRNEFLILGPAERLEDQEADRDSKRTGLDRQDDPVQDPAIVLEHILREVMSEGEFGQIMDRMLMQPTPAFSMYENSPPPGARFVSPLKLPEGMGTPCDSGDCDSTGGGTLQAPGSESMLSQLAVEPKPWSSRALLDLPPPVAARPHAASSSNQRPARGLNSRALNQTGRQPSRPPGSAGGTGGAAALAETDA